MSTIGNQLIRVQTNPGNVMAEATRLGHIWRLPGARSFSVEAVRYTDYHSRTAPTETGYADTTLTYYTGRIEGTTPVDESIARAVPIWERVPARKG
jgi:hypothetical protein